MYRNIEEEKILLVSSFNWILFAIILTCD